MRPQPFREHRDFSLLKWGCIVAFLLFLIGTHLITSTLYLHLLVEPAVGFLRNEAPSAANKLEAGHLNEDPNLPPVRFAESSPVTLDHEAAPTYQSSHIYDGQSVALTETISTSFGAQPSSNFASTPSTARASSVFDSSATFVPVAPYFSADEVQGAPPAAAASHRRPNILFIMSDDHSAETVTTTPLFLSPITTHP